LRMPSSRRWLTERLNEPYYRMAKERGYRSRAAFKLIQLDERFGFLRGAKSVVDLGSAPGGWLQVASERIGGDGLIVGVDRRPIPPLEIEKVKTIVGDVREDETMRLLCDLFREGVDVLLSDLSPEVSGIWEVDQSRQIELARAALRMARGLLRGDGWAVIKVFQGADLEEFIREVRGSFKYVRVVKPQASRKRSAEAYIVARGLRSRDAPS
jgi:23S rRNA (uridine2552-2'-O)-methyltransferase